MLISLNELWEFNCVRCRRRSHSHRLCQTLRTRTSTLSDTEVKCTTSTCCKAKYSPSQRSPRCRLSPNLPDSVSPSSSSPAGRWPGAASPAVSSPLIKGSNLHLKKKNCLCVYEHSFDPRGYEPDLASQPPAPGWSAAASRSWSTCHSVDRASCQRSSPGSRQRKTTKHFKVFAKQVFFNWLWSLYSSAVIKRTFDKGIYHF